MTLWWCSFRHLQIKISVIKGSRDCVNPFLGCAQKRIFHYRYDEGQLTVTENILCPLHNFIPSWPYLASKALLGWKHLFIRGEEYFTGCWLKRVRILWNKQSRGEMYNSPTLFSLPSFYLTSFFLLNIACLSQHLTNLMHKICFTISFISCLYMFRAYHHTYWCDDTKGCVTQFWPPDDEHMCSEHVEAWNKLIVKQILCIKLVKCWNKYTEMHD